MTDLRPTGDAENLDAPPGGHTGPSTPRRPLLLLAAVLSMAAVLVAVAMVMLWPGGSRRGAPDSGPPRFFGQAVSVQPQACPSLPEPSENPIGGLTCGSILVRLTSGPDAGTVVRTDIPNGPGSPVVRDGDKVVLIHLEDALGGTPYQIVDHQRAVPLWILVIAFALAVIAFGRWRGLTALAGLAVTFAVLLLFVVPAILDGASPLPVAIVGSAAIMLAVLYLTHGFSVSTTMAVLGTLVSLTLTGLLSAAATAMAKLSGMGAENANFLAIAFPGVNMQGLLLAGILIGSLGVLDDVTVTQAYTVRELAATNAQLGFGALYRGAARVGRAHIAAVINTIILAYAGASLPLLLLISAGNQPLGEVLTGQLMAEEIVRSIVGTLGLIAAVPITTALAALAFGGQSGRHVRGAPRPRRPDPLEAAWGIDPNQH